MKHIFIINPVAGLNDKTEQIREHLNVRTDIESIVFNTEEAGHEASIMKEMLDIFDDEPVRICVCGGSGTLSNALDGIDIDDMDHVGIGYYPCGLTNDFLKNFVEQGKRFENLDALIDGETKYVDYMRCVIDGNDNYIRNKLLFVTVGVAANIERISRAIKFLGGLSPSILYAICTVAALPFSPAIDYEVIIDGVDYSRDYKMIYVGNSVCFGGGFVPIKTGIDCRDGFLNVLLVKRIPAHKVLSYLKDFRKGELSEKHNDDAELITCKEILIRRKDNKSMNINSDGEIFVNNSWHIKVVNGRMKFVVPDKAVFVDGPVELIRNLIHS
ncbi:MAG: diacylglycerol kinase family protein [Lachnospiraceae bacterium]|nr:diacylglycerol kinase family protein [Lachnospiraceae bacterium]